MRKMVGISEPERVGIRRCFYNKYKKIQQISVFPREN